MAGSALSQIVLIVCMPIITRLYNPSEFAVLALFQATVSLAVVLVTGSYELAIVVAETRQEARRIACLALALAVGAMAALTVGWMLAGSHAARFALWCGMNEWVHWLPGAILLVACISILARWRQSRGEFALISRAELMGVVAATTVQVVAPRLVVDAGATHLLLGFLIGRGMVLTWMGIGVASVWWPMRWRPQWREYAGVARKHWRFPMFSLSSELLAVANAELPKFLIQAYFTTHFLGVFSLCNRVLEKPVTFVTSSVSPVIYQHVAKQRGNGQLVRNLVFRTTGLLAAAVVLPATVLMLVCPWLFETVFGEAWREAGLLARWLIPVLAVRFVVIPTWTALVALGKQHWVLLWNLSYLAVVSGVLTWAGTAGLTSLAIAAYTLANLVLLGLLLGLNLWAAHCAARSDGGTEPPPLLVASSAKQIRLVS